MQLSGSLFQHWRGGFMGRRVWPCYIKPCDTCKRLLESSRVTWLDYLYKEALKCLLFDHHFPHLFSSIRSPWLLEPERTRFRPWTSRIHPLQRDSVPAQQRRSRARLKRRRCQHEGPRLEKSPTRRKGQSQARQDHESLSLPTFLKIS